MANATSSKTTGKTNGKTAKQAAKPKAKSTAKTNGKTAKTAKPKAKPQASGAAKKIAPRAPKVDKYSAAAKLATALVQAQAGKKTPSKRGPVSTQQVDRVANEIGRRKPSDVLVKRLGFESLAQAERFSGDTLGKSENLPDGARAKMSEMSSAIGEDNHKIAGRKLTAILVALAR